MAKFNPPACVHDFEERAKSKLPKMVYDYYRNGADDEVTLKRNLEAFKRLIIRPRFMRNVSSTDTSTTLMNGKFSTPFPICIAPTGGQKMCHPDGELATAKAAEEMGTLMVVSTVSTTSLEDVALAAPSGRRWFQLYQYKSPAITEDIVRRAEKAGYEALVVTVDLAVSGKRRNDIRNSFALPSHLKVANLAYYHTPNGNKSVDQSQARWVAYTGSHFDSNVTWDTIRWLKTIVSMPIVLKGILTAEDADEACLHGIDAIIVSNHGARQLDSAPATIEALPEIVKAVNSRCEVYLDSGIRTGNDVFKALAMGAKAVFIGRPFLWGLTCDGKEGVKSVLTMLKDELTTTMALAGCKNLAEIQSAKNLVVSDSYYQQQLSSKL